MRCDSFVPLPLHGLDGDEAVAFAGGAAEDLPDGLLGKGAFGEVFRGYSVKKNCLIAVKTMEGESY